MGLRLRFGVLEVISTLLLNFVAEALVSFMVQGPLQERRGSIHRAIRSPTPPASRVLPGTRLHLGFLLALGWRRCSGTLFARTRWGFELRAVGTGARAAAISGRIDSRRVAAAGAARQSAPSPGSPAASRWAVCPTRCIRTSRRGTASPAIAVALLARLHPLGVVVAGLLFGALEAGAGGMQRDARSTGRRGVCGRGAWSLVRAS